MKNLVFLSLCVSAVFANASETSGVATIASYSVARTVVVAKDGSGTYTTIQAAANNARPGDLVLVKAGTYNEAPVLSANGTPAAGIVFENYPGQQPVIAAPGITEDSRLTISGNYVTVEGFEITNGWDGVVVTGAYDAILSNYIHENGTSCDNQHQYCGDGIMVVSTHDIVISGNLITRNGLTNRSPFHVHGIYLSDYNACNCMANISILGNTIADHGGAGLHSWDSTAVKTNVLVQGNVFRNNTLEIVFCNTNQSTISGNTFMHSAYPKTDSAVDTVLWLELSSNNVFSGNRFYYGVASPMKATSHQLVYLPSGRAGVIGNSFSDNTWDITPGGLNITDGLVMSALNGS